MFHIIIQLQGISESWVQPFSQMMNWGQLRSIVEGHGDENAKFFVSSPCQL